MSENRLSEVINTESFAARAVDAYRLPGDFISGDIVYPWDIRVIGLSIVLMPFLVIIGFFGLGMEAIEEAGELWRNKGYFIKITVGATVITVIIAIGGYIVGQIIAMMILL